MEVAGNGESGEREVLCALHSSCHVIARNLAFWLRRNKVGPIRDRAQDMWGPE